MSHLSSDCKLVEVLVTHRAVLFVLIIEDNRHAGFCDPCLPLLVDELLQAVCTDLHATMQASGADS